MGRTAKELCAMLITRSLANLTEDDEDVVVDYLEDLGIEVDLDTHPKELCLLLLEKTMTKDMGGKVPITAYANKILDDKKVEQHIKDEKNKERKTKQDRERIERNLQERSRNLPGCVPEMNVIKNTEYSLIVDEELGIDMLPDNTLQYSSVVSIPSQLYQTIYRSLENPIIEITTSKGYKGYARITSYHDDNDAIYITPLVGKILNINNEAKAFLKVCKYLPPINYVGFTFYGIKEDLDRILSDLIIKLPKVINAFSYLSLGLVLKTFINEEEISIRVDTLEDTNKMPIFAGILPLGDLDLSFEIESDM